MKSFISWIILLLFVTALFYGGYVCGENDTPPFHDKIYLQGSTDKHYIVVGTLPFPKDKKGISVYSNGNGEVIVMSPDKDTTRRILNAIDKAINEIELPQ